MCRTFANFIQLYFQDNTQRLKKANFKKTMQWFRSFSSLKNNFFLKILKSWNPWCANTSGGYIHGVYKKCRNFWNLLG